MAQCRRLHRDKTVLNEAPRTEDVCGSGGMGAVIPNLDSRWNRMVTFMPWSPYLQKKDPRYILGRKMCRRRRGFRRRPVRVEFLADLVTLVKVKVKVKEKVKFFLKPATKTPRG